MLGQITESLAYLCDKYGISKAGANFVAKNIDQEVPSVVSFPMQSAILISCFIAQLINSPGMIDTEMGRTGAAAAGMTSEQLGTITASVSAHGVFEYR